MQCRLLGSFDNMTEQQKTNNRKVRKTEKGKGGGGRGKDKMEKKVVVVV